MDDVDKVTERLEKNCLDEQSGKVDDMDLIMERLEKNRLD